MTDELSKEFAMAQRIGNGVGKKFPKHKVYVRELKNGDFSYFEIALRPDERSAMEDITVAYSSQWFAEIDETNVQERAQRILKDMRILMGVAV